MTTLPKILIVDDKPANLLALEEVLSVLQVEVIRANSGEEALASMLRHSFLAVLLDVKMPGMDGLETACLMQNYDKTMQTPVIFVTGQDADELDQLEGYATGAADYIVKPINPDILLSKVRLFMKLYLQTEELRNKYEETASLELSLKEKNRELEKNYTKLEQSNTERQQQYTQTRRLLELNPDGMLVIDHQHFILYTNPAASTIFNRKAEQLQGEHFDYPITISDHTEINIGSDNIVEMSVVAIDWDGKSAFLITLHNITERKQTEAKLIQLAQYDQLTGLANRRQCLEYTTKVLARSKRRNGYIAIMFLDLDKFKDINDSLGHDSGDDLLISVADRLRTCVREGDLAVRFGGDEFALILDDISEPEDAALIAQKILDAMAVPHPLNNEPTIVGCSIGIATFPLCGDDPETLFKAADIAMYHAKSEGRNNYQFFAKKMQQQLMDRIHLEQDLRHAIQRNELSLYYQPQVDVRTGNIVAFEALLRWHHSSEGMISPAQFIPVAEKTGLIIDIGEWVLQTACLQVQQWNDDLRTGNHGNTPPLTMAVNVSVKQLSNGDFIQRLKRAMEKTGVNPNSLEIELTESTMMDDLKSTFTELENMHREGLTISMDDFGTGYSSLSYLQRLPLNTLKIDQSFIATIGDAHSDVIVKTIIAMAHNLGLRVIAEGVEMEEQADFLRQNNCDLMQGYFFSRPVPYEQATLLLQNEFIESEQPA